jgi:hypothetical protein
VALAIPHVALVSTGGLKKFDIAADTEGPHYTDESFATLGQDVARTLYAQTH